MNFNDLNESQELAVKTIDGPVMVMAGAGAGKTKVLTSRVAYLIKEIGIAPSAILAVTFTNKAASEMKERIAKLTEMEVSGLWISTFHSFAARILRIEASSACLDKNFNIIDEEDSLKVIKEIMANIEDKSVKPQMMKRLISKSKNFNDFHIKDPNVKELFKDVKEQYELNLSKNHLLDFDDLIIRLVDLLEHNESVRLKYQRKFNYILVDEFQDTNYIQYKLVKLLTNEDKNIFVVGDDFQSIYSFRGAKIENIHHFEEDYKPKLILLEKNYRSTTEILNLANDVIKHNKNQIKKTLYSNDQKGRKPTLTTLHSDKAEAMYIVDEINKGILKGKKYSDFAVMYRNNYISRLFEDALISHQIPYKIYGSLSFFSRMEVKDILAYMRLICNKEDNYSLERIINVPKRKIGKATIDKLKELSTTFDCSLYDAISYVPEEDNSYMKLKRFKDLIISLTANLENIKLTDLVNIIVKETFYDEYLKEEYDTEEARDRLDNVNEIKTALFDINDEEGTNQEKLNDFLINVALRTDQDDKYDDNTVTLTTYHQAKGLEFDTVFMVATEDEIFPSEREDINIEEERRIFYVGVTRAKKRLYITRAKVRVRFGQKDETTLSRFVKELDESLYDDLNLMSKSKDKKKKEEIIKKLIEKVAKESECGFKVGDKVSHKVFGKGIIVRKRDNNIFDIAFSAPHGIKSLDLSRGVVEKL